MDRGAFESESPGTCVKNTDPSAPVWIYGIKMSMGWALGIFFFFLTRIPDNLNLPHYLESPVDLDVRAMFKLLQSAATTIVRVKGTRGRLLREVTWN